MNQAKIRIKSLAMTCNACPSQWEGRTEDGKFVYIRYRHGTLSAQVEGVYHYYQQLADSLAGVMSNEWMMEELGEIFEFPERITYD